MRSFKYKRHHKDWFDDRDTDIYGIIKMLYNVSKELFVLALNSFNRLRTKIQYKNLNLPLIY